MNPSSDSVCVPFPIENSALYHFWVMERVEIDRLKWLESERAGFDVGVERAHWMWLMHGHRAKWLAEMSCTTGIASH